MKRARQSSLDAWAQSQERSCKRKAGLEDVIRRAGLKLAYRCDFLPCADADALQRRLEDVVRYGRAEDTAIKLFGKVIPVPRRQAAYGDPGTRYTFSGQTVEAQPWIPELKDLRDRLAATIGSPFNFVLVNRYKDGSDYMGFHRDDEVDLRTGAPIASVSLGAERDFVFRHADAKLKRGARAGEPDVKLVLGHGSLLVMHAPTNAHWYHALPKRLRVSQPRINLTFRVMDLAGAAPEGE